MSVSAPSVKSSADSGDGAGFVSGSLEEEVREELRTRGVLVWLDKSGDFRAFVDGLRGRWLAGEFPYPVCTYRGSFLELMLQLDGLVEGRSNRPLLIHMPGFNFDEIRATPVLEHYEAGKVYRKALSTVVTEAAAGKVPPEEIEAFVGGASVGLEGADRWLEEQIRDTQGILEHLSLSSIWERLRGEPEKLRDVGDVESHLRARLGISAEWAETTGIAAGPGGEFERREEDAYFRNLGDWMTTWALAVEYVADLRREPFEEMLAPLRNLPQTLVEECHAFADALRENESAYYVRIADEFEALMGREVTEGHPEDLGDIDTFRFEGRRSFEAALEALGSGRWEEATTLAGRRTPKTSFWIRKQPRRGDAWELAEVAAKLGRAIDEADDAFAGMMSLEEAAGRYAEEVWKVDRAHRVMEQRRAALMVPSLPEFSTLLERLDELRVKYRRWSDQLARRFTDLCKEQGYVATESLQQRRVFDQVVAPLVRDAQRGRSEKVALFLVDALRFEMAAGLRDHFADTNATRAVLEPRLAELPSITEIGMSALAPVHQSGRLDPVIRKERFAGFQTPQFQVTGWKSRQKMMQHHVGGLTCPRLSLEEILNGEKELKRQIQSASLVLVHSREIDTAGEQGFGPLLFETMMRDIRSAMRLLRQAGVRRFVITSDHGFLMLDKTTERHSLGKKTETKDRWRLYDHPQSDENLVSLPLTALGYENAEGHLVLPRDTSVFDTGGDLPGFVHGGNSPQERIIPVLTVEHEREAGGSTTNYEIAAVQLRREDGLQGVTLSVKQSQSTLDFGGRAEVELAIRVVGDEDTYLELRSVKGAGRIEEASVVVPVEETVDLLFQVKGERDGKARLEVYAPTLREQVKSRVVKGWFNVHGVGKTSEGEKAEESVREEAAEAGLEALPEGPRKIFEYLTKYDAITEADAANLLGSPRALRRFSRKFEDYAGMVSFEVAVEQTAAGKRYVRK